MIGLLIFIRALCCKVEYDSFIVISHSDGSMNGYRIFTLYGNFVYVKVQDYNFFQGILCGNAFFTFTEYDSNSLSDRFKPNKKDILAKYCPILLASTEYQGPLIQYSLSLSEDPQISEKIEPPTYAKELTLTCDFDSKEISKFSTSTKILDSFKFEIEYKVIKQQVTLHFSYNSVPFEKTYWHEIAKDDNCYSSFQEMLKIPIVYDIINKSDLFVD
jgi:hypothetical protein